MGVSMYFLLLILLDLKVAHGCFVWGFPNEVPACCGRKKYGDDVYLFKSYTDTSEYDCIHNCTYTKFGDAKDEYCFKRQGNVKPVCQDGKVKVKWYNGMKSVQDCVIPGTEIVFYNPDNQGPVPLIFKTDGPPFCGIDSAPINGTTYTALKK